MKTGRSILRLISCSVLLITWSSDLVNCERDAVFLEFNCSRAGFKFYCNFNVSNEYDGVEIHFLNKQTFQHVNQFSNDLPIEVIFLNSNLKTVPDVLISINGLTLNNCQIKSLDKVNFQNTTKLLKLKLSNNQIEVIPNGVFSILTLLTDLSIDSNAVSELEWGCFDGLESLKRLELQRNQIDIIVTGLFDSLVLLSFIDLSHNRIAALPKDIFKNNVDLKEIKLTNNKLTDINFALVLPNLERFDLSYNLISEVSIDSALTYTKLRFLNLEQNQLTNLNSGIFSNLEALEDLNVSNNRIQDIAFVKNFTNLKKFDVSSNSIGQISLETFSKQTHLQRLILSGNDIKNIDSEAFTNLTMLTDLMVGNNSLADLRFLQNTPHLKILDISNNNLGFVNIDLFSNMGRLRVLNLSSTNIQGLDYGTFSHQFELNTLDLSYNQLNMLNVDILSALKALQYLFVDGNNLTEIDAHNLVTSHKGLVAIGLINNNWSCPYLSNLTKFMKTEGIDLRMRNAQIVKNDTNLSGIRCIKVDKSGSSHQQQHAEVHHTSRHNFPLQSNSMTESQISSLVNFAANFQNFTYSINIFGILIVIILSLFLVVFSIKNLRRLQPRYSPRIKYTPSSSVLLE